MSDNALTGRATLPDVGGKEKEMPVKVDVALPGGCTTRLETPEGTIVTGFQGGKQTAEGDQIPAVAAIGKSLEGATKRQRNPHRKGTLAWVPWWAQFQRQFLSDTP